ncbi:ATP-binding protein [Rubinisphaera brasiliensis]|uniref:Phage protein n=1 Tax=Rubinisphaera brasiliensis (strain ATCC 49424 / DSM 5305 / JCM 21570 / IAM 15109 / NBRC 103401 / IFAM 1448) TaxID=756272 RepID=F0SNJ2_RUBBR|nr:ATP-binding protein [Rubinisphaera brasiliensis]ADY57826.1 hypothetical protein Plabr_0196 [Rubinisphaera brasiliensis DSM 5305]
MSIDKPSLLSQVTPTKKMAPRRILLYGVDGIGKSTFGAEAPKPIFINVEKGLDDIDAHAFPRAESYQDVMKQTYALATEEHDFQTLVVDTADWFERFIVHYICEKTGANSINDPYNDEVNFNKGIDLVLDWWEKWIDLADKCQEERGMNIILLAHCHTPKFKDPTTDSYHRYEPKLSKASSERLREWVHEVLFATYEVFTEEKDEGFKQKRNVGHGSGRRVLKTVRAPSHEAKNRLAGMPDEIELKFSEYWKYVKGAHSNGASV